MCLSITVYINGAATTCRRWQRLRHALAPEQLRMVEQGRALVRDGAGAVAHLDMAIANGQSFVLVPASTRGPGAMEDQQMTSEKLHVSLDGQRMTRFRGMRVRHLLTLDQAHAVEAGLATVVDGQGHVVGLDGALSDGQGLHFRPAEDTSQT